jgi:CcmD family protein
MDQTQFTFLFWAYFVAWMGVLLYVAAMVLRERKLRRQLESLEEQMKDLDAD